MNGRVIAAGFAIAAALASTAAAVPAAEVTMRVEHIGVSLLFSGTIASSAANEYVVVLERRCGYKSWIPFTGALTETGGGWEAARLGTWSSGTYRARWKASLSDPVTLRPPLPVEVEKLRGRRYRVRVDTSLTLQNMSGRIVELQRRDAAGLWTRVRSARLVTDARRYRRFTATFLVRTRGLTLRVLVPQRSASPCYTFAVTETWVS